jgi:pimeloyl-ACP methyl ester carboxylesterase
VLDDGDDDDDDGGGGAAVRFRMNAGNSSSLMFAQTLCAWKATFTVRRVSVVSAAHNVETVWTYSDAPSLQSSLPVIVAVGGLSSDHTSLFRTQMWLFNHGARCIAVSVPTTCTSHAMFVDLFDAFLTRVELAAVDVCFMGSMLGAYLLQLYAAQRPAHVAGLVLCSPFCSTAFFQRHPPLGGLAGWMPEFMLKRKLLSALPAGELDADDVDGIDFLVGVIEQLPREAIVNRMALMCAADTLDPSQLRIARSRIAVVVAAPGTLNPKLPDAVRAAYDGCRVCTVKSDDEFYSLTRAHDQFAMQVLVHLRSLVIAAVPPE